jgi:hypothetical protein
LGSDQTHLAKGLDGLLRLMAQTEGGLDQYVYPYLRFGDVWWIPDAATGLSKEQHPWIIVRSYSAERATVAACLRTTSFQNADRKHGIVMPANILPGLNREGLILPMLRRTFNAEEFQNYQYVDRLPEEWIRKIHEFYIGRTR